MNDTITLRQLAKSYKKKCALKPLSVAIPHGKFLLSGRNGVGKTTLLKILAGLEEPSEGTIERPPWASSAAIASDCIVYPEILAIRELADLYVKEGKLDKNAFEQRIKHFNLTPYLSTLVGELSTGSLQKLRLCLALASSHPLVLLDEPLNGLDNESVLVALDEIAQEQRPMIIVDHEKRCAPHVKGKIHIDEAGSYTITP